jgi:hypothetical protein
VGVGRCRGKACAVPVAVSEACGGIVEGAGRIHLQRRGVSQGDSHADEESMGCQDYSSLDMDIRFIRFVGAVRFLSPGPGSSSPGPRPQ